MLWCYVAYGPLAKSCTAQSEDITVERQKLSAKQQQQQQRQQQQWVKCFFK